MCCGDDACDGEVAVITGLIETYPWFVPPFVMPEAEVASHIHGFLLAVPQIACQGSLNSKLLP